jgi:hypothetical protein
LVDSIFFMAALVTPAWSPMMAHASPNVSGEGVPDVHTLKMGSG